MKKFFKFFFTIVILAVIVFIIVLIVKSLNSLQLTVTPSASSLKVGETITIDVTPSKTIENPVYVFVSSEDSKATVDSSGVLTAIAVGTVKVTVSLSDQPDVKATTGLITINEADVLLTDIAISVNNTSLVVGDTTTFTLTFNPDNATNQAVNITSSDISVIAINDHTIVATGAGTATVTVTSISDSSISVTSGVITVTPADVLESIEAIIDDKVEIGSSKLIEVNYTPTNTPFKSVTYTSTNPSILEVSELGIITGKAKGAATVIIISTVDPSISTETQSINVYDQNFATALNSLQDKIAYEMELPFLHAQTKNNVDADADGFTPELIGKIEELLSHDYYYDLNGVTLFEAKDYILSHSMEGFTELSSNISYLQINPANWLIPEYTELAEDPNLIFVIFYSFRYVYDTGIDYEELDEVAYAVVAMQPDGYYHSIGSIFEPANLDPLKPLNEWKEEYIASHSEEDITSIDFEETTGSISWSSPSVHSYKFYTATINSSSGETIINLVLDYDYFNGYCSPNILWPE